MDGPILAYLVCEEQYIQLQTLGPSPSHSLNETTSSFHREWGSSITDSFELGLMRESPWFKSCPFSLYLVNQEPLETYDLTCVWPLQIIMSHSWSIILPSLPAYFSFSSFFMWTIFIVFVVFIELLPFYVLVFWLQDMWDLSSLTRDWTHTPLVLEGEVLTAGPPGKSLMPVLRTIQDAMGIPMWLDPVQTGGWASSQPLFAAVVL